MIAEAKRFGIKTGTSVGEARRLCPNLQIVEARPRLYRQTHEKIVKAVKTTGVVVSGPVPLPTRKRIFTVLR